MRSVNLLPQRENSYQDIPESPLTSNRAHTLRYYALGRKKPNRFFLLHQVR